jgi:hypothetical protein
MLLSGAFLKRFQMFVMELRLLRAQFPNSIMAQLFMNNQLLCIYVGADNQKGWTPIAGLPDGKYYLHKPHGEDNWGTIQVSDAGNRMKLNRLLKENLTDYDSKAPLYVNWGADQQQLTDLAKQHINTIMAAIDEGEEVHLSIFSQYLG